MDKFIDVIVDGILSNFDFGFMFIVNVLTYIIIKTIDYFNGDNKVPTWQTELPSPPAAPHSHQSLTSPPPSRRPARQTITGLSLSLGSAPDRWTWR